MAKEGRTTRSSKGKKEEELAADEAVANKKRGREPKEKPSEEKQLKQRKAAAPKAAASKKAVPPSTEAMTKESKSAEKPAKDKKTAAAKADDGPKPAGKGPAAGGGGPVVSGLWLIKSEPDEYSLDTLRNEPNSTGFWDGVRNLQARNLLQKMKLGDKCFFYHSSCKVPGIVGIAEVVEEATPDLSAFDESSDNFDPKSQKDKPRWFGVRVQFRRELKRQITLEELKKFKEGELSGLTLLRVPRLSVQIVSKKDWDFILAREHLDASA